MPLKQWWQKGGLKRLEPPPPPQLYTKGTLYKRDRAPPNYLWVIAPTVSREQHCFEWYNESGTYSNTDSLRVEVAANLDDRQLRLKISIGVPLREW